MKTPTLLVLILLIASPAYGQTTDYVPYFTDSSGTLGNSVMYQSGTNIGIGTTSPAYPLEVGAGSGQVIARINGGSSGAAGGGVLYFGSGGTTTSAIGGLSAITGGAFNSDLAIYGASTTNNKLHFYAGSSESMTLTSNSVGIATTSPANTLDIGNSGGIHITSGVPTSTSNALYNNSGTLTWNGSALAAASAISGTTNYIPYFASATSLGNSMIYQSGSKIGIGTTSPLSTFDVEAATAGTSGTVNVLDVFANSSGTVANSFGPLITFTFGDTHTTNNTIGAIGAVKDVSADTGDLVCTRLAALA